MSLRARLTLLVAGVVAAAVMAGAFATRASAEAELAAETDRFLRDRAGRIARGEGGPVPGLTGSRPGPGGGRGRLFGLDAVTQIISAGGSTEPLFSGEATLPVDGEDLAIAAAGGAGRPRLRTTAVDGVNHRVITAPLPGGGAVQVARSLAETEAVLDALRNRLVAIVAAGTAVAALVAWAVAQRATRPIVAVTKASEHVARTQDLTTPIPNEGTDEVGRLARSFNTMLAALGTSRDQQRRLVMDASHELRTPLTAVRANVDFLRRAGGLASDERARLLDETRAELVELTNLVAELVELAADVRSEEPIEALDLARIAEDVAARFRRRSGRPVTVSLEGTPAAVEGRAGMVGRAISNLVDNALKFSPPESGVEIEVDGAGVRVLDRGPGIDPAERPRVFDRFFRASTARTAPGSGLGLAIVRQIAEVHGGRASVSDREGGGTVATLQLVLPVRRA